MTVQDGLPLRIGSLFSGIGGLELGLERSGLGHTVWQVEQDPFCQSILARHWPRAERFSDVKEVGAQNLAPVDLICGGFPCQPFSTASRGRRVAQDLWPEMCRIVGELDPRWVVAENVTFDPIYKAGEDLSALGYESAAVEVPAAVVGAAHERPRWFLVAYAHGHGKPRRPEHEKMARVPDSARYVRAAIPGAMDVNDGIPGRMVRLRALGNAVVPQCAEVIGWMIRELVDPRKG